MNDEDIARHLEASLRSGELKSAESFGKPLAEDAGYRDTPDGLRMPFKILKNAGYVPPEVEAMKRRAQLSEALAACSDAQQAAQLRQQLSELEQAIALRLEGLRMTQRL